MRRFNVALIVSVCWLAAMMVAAGAFVLFGAGLVALVIAGLAASAAAVAGMVVGRRADRAAAARLAVIGQAVGVRDGEAASLEAIVSSLGARLDRAHNFKSAFAALRQPAVLIGGDGEILGATGGLTAAEPAAEEGGIISDVLGGGMLLEDMAAESIAVVGDRRYVAERRELGGGRSLIEFSPAGYHIADDDFDAF
ncbi:hypothetical protein, partial [Devosia sp.]|uniref:hypothetical protein n=1 Tax=Devosia sp. TaxID=1871048 RepID=UPI001AC0FB81